MVLYKKGKQTLTRASGRWGLLQEVLGGDKWWPESREDEQQVWLFHIHPLVGRKYLSFSGNTVLGSTPNTEQDGMLLSLLSFSREVAAQAVQGSYICAGFGSRPDLLVHRQHFQTRTLSSREAKWIPKVAWQAQVGWRLNPHLLLLTVCTVGNSLSGLPGYLLALQIHMLWP